MRAELKVAVAAVALSLGCGTGQMGGSGVEPAPADLILGTYVHKMPLMNDIQVTTRAAPTGAHLNYYGGHVVANASVVVVFWGPRVNSTVQSQIGGFYSTITSSAYVDWLTEYNTNITAMDGRPGTNQFIGHGTFAGSLVITPSITSTSLQDADIQRELNAQISAGKLPPPDANKIYMVYFPPGVVISQGGSQSCVAGGFCAYHGTFVRSGTNVYYGIMPDMGPGSGCDVGCGRDPSMFNNMTSVSSHELIETITDAEVGLATVVGRPLAWYDPTNGEIGDICNATQATVAGYVVQTQWSNVSNACIATRTVSNDFSISLNPSTRTTPAGTATTFSVVTATTSGAAQRVNLSISGLPASISSSFNPTAVNSGASATLTLTPSATTAAGTYNFTVTGTGTGATRTTSGSITVTSVVTNDFSIALNPTTRTTGVNTSTTYTVNTAVTSGSAQTINLSISGLPATITASFSPASVTAGRSSTLTLRVAATATRRTTAFTVTGKGTSATHSATGSITVR